MKGTRSGSRPIEGHPLQATDPQCQLRNTSDAHGFAHRQRGRHHIAGVKAIVLSAARRRDRHAADHRYLGVDHQAARRIEHGTTRVERVADGIDQHRRAGVEGGDRQIGNIGIRGCNRIAKAQRGDWTADGAGVRCHSPIAERQGRGAIADRDRLREVERDIHNVAGLAIAAAFDQPGTFHQNGTHRGTLGVDRLAVETRQRTRRDRIARCVQHSSGHVQRHCGGLNIGSRTHNHAALTGEAIGGSDRGNRSHRAMAGGEG